MLLGIMYARKETQSEFSPAILESTECGWTLEVHDLSKHFEEGDLLVAFRRALVYQGGRIVRDDGNPVFICAEITIVRELFTDPCLACLPITSKRFAVQIKGWKPCQSLASSS